MKKIYIAGAGGMLGEGFYSVLRDNYILRCTDKHLTSEWLELLDFRDYHNYENDVKSFDPDMLFHIGAHTSLEYCELNEYDAYETNTLSVEYAVRIANKLDIPLLYISTAGIFDGTQEVYDDWDTPNPLGVYARSKYMGERYVVENSKRYLVCRAGWMMGGGPSLDKKFINKLVKQIESGAKVLNVVDDKDGTPTFTHDFARNAMLLMEEEKWGVYNMVCGGLTSRFEVAEFLLQLLEKDHEIAINRVDSSFFQEEYFAERPLSERLVNKRLDILGLNIMSNWRDALRVYIEAYFK